MSDSGGEVGSREVVVLSDDLIGLECGFCDGTGVFPETCYDDPNDRTIYVCPVCDGSSFIVVAANSAGYFECRACGGDDKTCDENGCFVGDTCPVCGGRGFLNLSDVVAGHQAHQGAWSIIHPEVREVARPRFESGHYADAVEAAFKHFNARVKRCVPAEARGDADGSSLMERVFSARDPLIVLTTLDDPSGRDEQLGYMKMFSGAMTGIRNPKAHDNVDITPERALQLLVMASLFCAKLDEALATGGEPETDER